MTAHSSAKGRVFVGSSFGEEHPWLSRPWGKAGSCSRDSRWVGGGKMWSFAAGQQETHVCLEAGDLWGLESGICLLVAPEISLVEEDFFSPTPGPFQKQTPQLLVCSKSSLYGFAWVLNLSSEITSVQRIYVSALLKGSFFPKRFGTRAAGQEGSFQTTEA